jgi:hypothetical protein
MKTDDGYLITRARQCFRQQADRPLRPPTAIGGYNVLIIKMRILEVEYVRRVDLSCQQVG